MEIVSIYKDGIYNNLYVWIVNGWGITTEYLGNYLK